MFSNICLKKCLTKRTTVPIIKTNSCSESGGVFMEDMEKMPATKQYKIWTQKELIFVGVLFILMVFVLTTLLMNMDLVKAAKGAGETTAVYREKIVTTICIEKDSTLWDIATRYYTEEYQDLNDMIEEIKKSNDMVKDTIHEGAYLIIPYYVNCEITPHY